jgi:hypothetical protein
MAFTSLRRRSGGSLGAPVQRSWTHPASWLGRRNPGWADDHEHQSINAHHKWRRSRTGLIAQVCAYFGALLLGVFIVQAVAVVIFSASWTYVPLDNRCQNDSVSCGLLSGIAAPLFTIAFASAAFLFFRLSRVRKGYRRRAKKKPRDLVPTAGRILRKVVGRDELCYVIMDNLSDPQTRRAFVIVGGVGAGKTAVLVQLTRLLAKAKAIPVPIMLRDAQSEQGLNFLELAKIRFCREVSGSLLYEGEGERAWRQFTRDGRIVVLADGLEEALIDNDERNNLIRLAITQANTQKLPLIIASRPHAPLRNMNAAIVELEPLSEEAAFSYLKDNSKLSRSTEQLDWIIETAEVTEEPLYLQITRDLHEHRLLEPHEKHITREDREAGRTQLRVRLLDAWIDAVIEGHFPEGLPMSREDRHTAIECATALACIGLKLDSVDVKLADLLGSSPQETEKSPPETKGNTEESDEDTGEWATIGGAERKRKLQLRELKENVPHPLINKVIAQRHGGVTPDVQVAAAWGEQLELMDIRGSTVRFPHSILQAYLGSLMMPAALRDDTYCRKAAQRPGREFLIALVMYFCSQRARELAVKCDEDHQNALQQWETDVDFVIGLLKQSAAAQETGSKKLDVYAAALEIDSANGGLQHEAIAKLIHSSWPPTTVTYDRPLEEAKLNLVRRLGETVRKVAEMTRPPEPPLSTASDNLPLGPARIAPAYAQLYQIGIEEKSYPVRLAVALEIGCGGEQAYSCLKSEFLRVLEEVRNIPNGPIEPSEEKVQRKWREHVLCAWLAPLLAGSVGSAQESPLGSGTGAGRAHESPRSILGGWLRLVRGGPRDPALPVSLEIALAQGFKYAANRQLLNKSVQPGTREWLAEEAMEMLKRSRFWFTQLTLLHALCLWTLRDDTDAEPEPGGHGSQPEAIVGRWLAVAGNGNAASTAAGRAAHPFVHEAASLVVLALKEQRPERYIWIDESGVTGIVGSHAEGSPTMARRSDHLWIPPSSGWSVLDPRAQRLVADVLLLLNLAERGDRPEDHDRRLGFTDRLDLPPCLTDERSYLNPDRPIGAAGAGVPGSNCKDDCQFGLCPYPPWGGPSYRVELSGPFCRNQQVMLGRSRRAAAPWQSMPARDLKQSWGLMADRSRGTRRADDTG